MKRFGLRLATLGAGDVTNLLRWLLCCVGLLYVLAGNGLVPLTPQNSPLGQNLVGVEVVGLEGLPDKRVRPTRGEFASWELFQGQYHDHESGLPGFFD